MRLAFLCVTLFAVSNASGAISCAANVPNAAAARSEGTTEQVGDIVLICTGGTPTAAATSIPRANIQIFFNVPVTSRLKTVGTVTASEALLLADEPNSGIAGASTTFLGCTTPDIGCGIVGNGTGVGTYSGG